MENLTSGQIERIWQKTLEKSGKARRWDIFANAALIFSLALLVVMCGVTFINLNAHKLNPTEVDVQLQLKNSQVPDNHSLYIVRDDGSEDEVLATDYKIEDDKLKINLTPGTYKIVLVSNKYQTYIATATVN